MFKTRTHKKTVKLTEAEFLKYDKFTTHHETRTWSRLIRRALYEFGKAREPKPSTPAETQADRVDQINAKKLTDSMRAKTPSKRGPVPGKNGRPKKPATTAGKSDQRSQVGRRSKPKRKASQDIKFPR